MTISDRAAVIQRAQEWLDGDQAKYTVDWVVELIRDLKEALESATNDPAVDRHVGDTTG